MTRPPFRRVGSARAAGPAVGGRCHRRDDTRGRRLVDPRGPGSRPRRRRLRLPDRRLGHAPTRPAVAASAGGRPPALANFRPRGLRLARPGLDGSAAGRRGGLRAARRHLHSRGHVRRGARAGSTTCARIGVDLVELMPVNAPERRPQLGLRRRALARRPRAVRRPGRLPAVRGRLPPGRPRRDPGRRLQPPGAVGELPAGVRPLPQERAATPGATWSTSTARARRRCAGSSSTTCGCGSTTTTSTACGSTPCTPSTTPPRCTCWRRWRSRWPRCRPTSAGR